MDKKDIATNKRIYSKLQEQGKRLGINIDEYIKPEHFQSKHHVRGMVHRNEFLQTAIVSIATFTTVLSTPPVAIAGLAVSSAGLRIHYNREIKTPAEKILNTLKRAKNPEKAINKIEKIIATHEKAKEKEIMKLAQKYNISKESLNEYKDIPLRNLHYMCKAQSKGLDAQVFNTEKAYTYDQLQTIYKGVKRGEDMSFVTPNLSPININKLSKLQSQNKDISKLVEIFANNNLPDDKRNNIIRAYKNKDDKAFAIYCEKKHIKYTPNENTFNNSTIKENKKELSKPTKDTAGKDFDKTIQDIKKKHETVKQNQPVVPKTNTKTDIAI